MTSWRPRETEWTRVLWHYEELQWLVSSLEFPSVVRGQLTWIRKATTVAGVRVHYWHVEEHAVESSSASCLLTSPMAVQSQVAAASTEEGLRAKVAAAEAGKEAGLSPSASLGVACLHPQDFAHRDSVPAHSIFSSLHLAKWAASAFVFLTQEKKPVVCCTAEKPQAESLLIDGDRGPKSRSDVQPSAPRTVPMCLGLAAFQTSTVHVHVPMSQMSSAHVRVGPSRVIFPTPAIELQ